MIALAVFYYLWCMPQHYIGKKLGNNDTWMAYVPFARNIQRMRMVNMPMWKLLFVGGLFTFYFVAFLLICVWVLFHAGGNGVLGFVVAALLGLVYIVLWAIYTWEFNSKVAKKFGFITAPYALLQTLKVFPLFTLPFVLPVSVGIEYMIALSDRYYVGKPPADEKRVPPVDPATIGLYGVSGMYSGAKFTMKPGDEFVIGRDGTLANVIISTNGEKVSRRHCTVTFNSSTCNYEVTDFSSNGTYHGNERLLKGHPTPIARGTTLVIGDKNNSFKLM